MYNRNTRVKVDHFGSIDATLNTTTGELTLTLYKDAEQTKEAFSTTCQLRDQRRKDVYTLRFTMDKHPETQRKEDFQVQLVKSNHLWFAYIYPQYGRGTITKGKLYVKTEGRNEFFD